MNDLIKKAEMLKKKIAKLKTEADKASGIIHEKKQYLKKEFGVSSLKEAKELLETMKQEEKELKETFETELEAFEDLCNELE